MLWILLIPARFRYLFGSQCESGTPKYVDFPAKRCVRRAGHKGWHSENGNMWWGDRMY